MVELMENIVQSIRRASDSVQRLPRHQSSRIISSAYSGRTDSSRSHMVSKAEFALSIQHDDRNLSPIEGFNKDIRHCRSRNELDLVCVVVQNPAVSVEIVS